ncbi:MAG TPA: methylenetetrahydrofolate--tRNA-(uracil(54)-C(5))-methyltransferase (FADH(2)-oxidizing) TrmFO, partial [Thermodesulfobacteriota bacterium]|nr:methylenetetrahydrofolate--tRNA-(uracil(54)-C(5))-methyltransferase (FADH(2)-oxidizing) TrmFO [Thermodesulfobacteriota bacterium]
MIVVGGGFAGCEAAWQAARRGAAVTLYEMKPVRISPAHRSTDLCEVVCSNSLGSDSPDSAPGLLKRELRALDSVVLRAAERHRVPAGQALAVDRERFAAEVTRAIEATPGITVVREEVTELPLDPAVPTIVATGPMTSDALAASLARLVGGESLYFYDAIAPIVTAESIDMSVAFRASRYDSGPGDYLNCPLTEEQYHAFVRELLAAEKVPPHPFEEEKVFEGCLPIEVMAARGPLTLAYGPMKPVGLVDPRTGKRPFAVVQLRQEDAAATLYNMVGFQTKLKYPEQKRVFRMIPGLERAEFVRLGSLHRNVFLNAPRLIDQTLRIRHLAAPLFLAGQMIGVEGYVESCAMGALAGIHAARLARGEPLLPPPRATALGSLVHYLVASDPRHFQPMNINFGLLPDPPAGVPREQRRAWQLVRAAEALAGWLRQVAPAAEDRSPEVRPEPGVAA